MVSDHDIVTEQDLAALPPDGVIHVYPLFGREHEATVNCWCQPKPLPDEPRVFLHHADN